MFYLNYANLGINILSKKANLYFIKMDERTFCFSMAVVVPKIVFFDTEFIYFIRYKILIYSLKQKTLLEKLMKCLFGVMNGCLGGFWGLL